MVNKGTRDNKIQVSHINIRLSISILLLRLLVIELVGAILVILLHSSLFVFDGEVLEQMGMQTFNILFFSIFVFIKTALTVFVILQWLNEYYEITSTVIYHRKGLIFKTEEKYPLEHIGFVEVKQGIFGKILNFGTISLYDKGRNKYVDMYLIHNPMRYTRVIEELLPQVDEKKQILREHIIEKDIFDTD